MQFGKKPKMQNDITNRLSTMLSWENAEEAVKEIRFLRQMVQNWQQTAEMLAMDLGKVEYAQVVYEDVADGLYEKVRARLNRD